jgi:endoglucanase
MMEKANKQCKPFLNAPDTVKALGIGWNLGNSLDAVSGDIGLASETSWHNPKVTEELILAVKNAGFNTVRIPITWQFHFDRHFDKDYIINPEWFARVDEITHYVTDNGMYAIINIHHDGQDSDVSWLKPHPADKSEEDGMVRCFAALWKQIAEHFENFGGELLFAGMNEFHHGSDYKDNYNKEYLRITDRLNQAFIDTVRGTGGNNRKRVLVFQSYNTQTEAAMGMKIPTDSEKELMALEIHTYDPWSFAGEGIGTWSLETNEPEVQDRFGKLTDNFVKKGIPVIIGEYGCSNGGDPSRIDYIRYVTAEAVKRGFAPVWWDNNTKGIGADTFALIDRTDNSIYDKAAMDAIMDAKKYL